jgi:hypothetical protein
MSPRMRDMLTWRAHPEPTAYDFATDDVLHGMSPRLVIELARLAGASLRDLSVTLHLMPYGDRAVMVAYGLIEMGPEDGSGHRALRVDPFCLEVVAAAAELVASVVDPTAVAVRLAEFDLADATYVPVATLEEQSGEGRKSFTGLVQNAEHILPGMVQLDVALREPEKSGPIPAHTERIVRVVTEDKPSFHNDALVSLAYPASEKPLSIAQLTAEQ